MITLRFTSSTVRDKNLLEPKLALITLHTLVLQVKKMISHLPSSISVTRQILTERDASYTHTKLICLSEIFTNHQCSNLKSTLRFHSKTWSQKWLSFQVTRSKLDLLLSILIKKLSDYPQRSTALTCHLQSERDIKLMVLIDFHVMIEKLPILFPAKTSKFTACHQTKDSTWLFKELVMFTESILLVLTSWKWEEWNGTQSNNFLTKISHHSIQNILIWMETWIPIQWTRLLSKISMALCKRKKDGSNLITK